MYRRLMGLALVLFAAAMGGKAAAIEIDDLEFIAGQGNNTSILVFDWDGADSSDFAFAWGYRWDPAQTPADNPTVFDMITQTAGHTAVRQSDTGAFIADYFGADERLFVRMSLFSFGETVFGVGYDLDGDGGSFVPGNEGSGDEIGFATDPDDLYAEGFFTGFWNSTTDLDADGLFDNGFAVMETTLTDGAAYAWTFDGDFSFDDVPLNIQPAEGPPVPEPTTALLTVLVGVALSLRERRRRLRV